MMTVMIFLSFVSANVFSKSLAEQFDPAKSPAPLVVVKCVEAIETKGKSFHLHSAKL